MKLSFKTAAVITSFLCLLACNSSGEGEANSSTTETSEPTGPPLFSLLTPQQTHISFQNTLNEGLNTNVLMYEYFYNGGGVAAGDLNGDGWTDLYFSANLSSNQLYIGQGNMQFQEVTAASGAGGRPGPWRTGVCFVDINGDKRLDIYICYSGAMPEPKRANQLFINQGNDANNVPIFKDEASAYGLASVAFSNQAYFFDYDRDGDLDMLLLNHNPRSLPVLNEAQTVEALKIDDPLRGVRLFKQIQTGKFKDITQQAGISGSALTYGLGIGITDVNNDGWPDFYISNDYTIPDYLYINNGNGTFSDKLQESLGHNSHFSMGNDIADINNDGLQDIVTLDMLPEDNRRQKLLMAPDNYAKFDLNVRSGFHYQYMRNMLQLNNGDGTFSEIGQLAGMSNTDWSWAALLADYDNDGWKDLFVTNGYKRDYTNLDFLKYKAAFTQSKGRLRREDVLEIINQMPASNVVNYMFANTGGQTFANQTRSWGFQQTSNSNGAAYADLDNDGDLDLVVNNINQPAFIYQNETQQTKQHYLQVQLQGERLNTAGIGAKVELFYGGRIQTVEQYPSRGYLSSVSPVLHVGLGDVNKVDSLIVQWSDGKQQLLLQVQADQRLVLEEKNATSSQAPPVRSPSIFKKIPAPIAHQHPEMQLNDFDRQPLLISELSCLGPCMAKGDLNGDGREDVIIGGAIGQSTSIYIQAENGRFKPRSVPVFITDQQYEDADIELLDANGDGALDLYIASGGYHRFASTDERLQDRLYLNDGKGNFTGSPKALPSMRMSTGAIAARDVNQDGHIDIFVGGRVIPGRYPEAPSSYLLINDGRGQFSDQTATVAPDLQQPGMITDAAWINAGKNPTLVLVGEWMAISVFELQAGKLEDKTLNYFDKAYTGWWNTLTLADVNNDQRVDLLVGNMGTNTQFQVSAAEPAEMYVADFDKNGAIDPLFCFYIQGVSYPYVTRDELFKQLTQFRSTYTSYESYADIRITDMFPKETLKQASHMEATHMETSLFVGQADGSFKAVALPVQAQYAPVYAIQVLDYDADGHADILMAGNNSHFKLRLGKLDANYGTLFKGDGSGGFNYIRQPDSGFKLQGDVRSILQLGNTLLLGMNQAPIVAYRLQKK